jgi:hypothetical protein
MPCCESMLSAPQACKVPTPSMQITSPLLWSTRNCCSPLAGTPLMVTMEATVCAA